MKLSTKQTKPFLGSVLDDNEIEWMPRQGKRLDGCDREQVNENSPGIATGSERA